jgi:hypothetical protein
MQELRVIGIEEGALLLAGSEDERFSLPINDELQARLRERTLPSGVSRKISPREIQAHIRAGMTAQDVATVTGVELDYVQRFEGPVLAERQYVIDSALSVPVHTASDADPLGLGPDFGTVIRERLAALGATQAVWSSWKQQNSDWTVGLAFRTDGTDHDARWQFDAKRQTLSPVNAEARSLSQQEEIDAPLIPRLRAVPHAEKPADTSRFDSGAFVFDVDLTETGPSVDLAPRARTESKDAVELAAIKRAEPEGETHSEQTEDLLEALRRRRGEREAALFDEEPEPSVDFNGSVTLIDIPMDEFTPAAESASGQSRHASTKPQPQLKSARGGRATMPSWDEIVFGTRTDED